MTGDTKPAGARPWALAVGSLVVVVMAVRPVLAATPSDEAAAETLFASGKDLMAGLRFDEACIKLDASRRLSPGIGITMWLADCQEKAGRLASAWLGFRDAASLAHRQGDSRAKLAEVRAASLEPRLARVRVIPAGAAGAVYRDDVRLPEGALDVATPVDRGRYRFRFVAPDGASRLVVLAVTEDGRTYEVRPMDGEPRTEPHARPAAAPPEASAPPPRHDRTLGFVFFGVAALGLGVATGFGIDAANAKSRSNDGHCVRNTCDAEGVSLRDGALRSALISTIAFAMGAVALGAGAATFVGVFDGASSGTAHAPAGAITW